MVTDPSQGFVRVGDLTEEMIASADRAARTQAAHEGWLREYDREYRSRIARLDRDTRRGLGR